MNILSRLFSSFLFFLPLPHFVANTQTCSKAICRDSRFDIRFPFRLQGQQPKTCGYPGFTVSCKEGQTLLKLPPSGEFTIQGIDYATQELWLNDPNNCLPKRILSLNLSESPFSAVYHQEFTFFNCSSDYFSVFLKYWLDPISCLSDSNYTVLATTSSSVVMYMSSVCTLVDTVKVPVQWPFYEQISSSDLSEDLRLSWNSPACGRCESGGGQCGFKSDSSHEVACFGAPSRGIGRGVRYGLGIGIGAPAALFLLGLVCYICYTNRAHNWSPESVPDFNTLVRPTSVVISGLDGPTIESYPKIILGESGCLPKSDDNACSICLSEYRAKETLKIMPACQHCFHADCIDEWLRLKATCPVCRTSPAEVTVGS